MKTLLLKFIKTVTLAGLLSPILLAAALTSCSDSGEVTTSLSHFSTVTVDSYRHEFYLPFMIADGEADEWGWDSGLSGTWNPEEGLFRNPEGLSTWAQFKFPNPTRLTSATVYWDPKVSDKNIYSLEYSKDGRQWGKVPGFKYTREKTEVNGLGMLRDAVRFRPVKARLFRVRIEAGNDSTGFGRLREVELMGDLRQFDTLESVKRILNGETIKREPLKSVNNPSDPWHLDLPRPDAGTIADGVYYAAPGLENDADGNTDFCSQMQVVSGCTAEDFQKYVEKLTAAGYEPLGFNCIEKNIHAQFKGQDRNVYAYYTDSEHYMRVICENSVVTQDKFSYKAETTLNAGVYQYALNYTVKTHETMDCGMLYAILPGDGSAMVIDGGHQYQTSEEFYSDLYDFLREVTQTPEGEKLRISCWFITHAHGDHIAGASGFLRRYHDKVDLQRVMFNFPAYVVWPASTGHMSHLRLALKYFYPDVEYLRPHTGMHLDFGPMGIDVMYTHEDAINAQDPTRFPLRDFNSSSTVLKLTMGGCSAVLYGDISKEGETIIVRNYPPALWKTDLVQVAHHCYNYLTTLYGWNRAPLVLVPNGKEICYTEKHFPKLQDALKFAKDGVAYLADEETFGFCPSEDGFKLCYRRPLAGKLKYDGTGN